ncbi:MAG: ABC transporter permease [Gemmatimonadetes bacterium]|jgi:ABC-type transport system involved in multi-copper enzyme maturation permease subunit|nr:ABC transporter permease [Gemmatimonadota bacterium]
MLRTIIVKELLSNLLTLRLAVALAFTVVLTVMTAFIGSAEYSRNVDRFEQAQMDAATELQTVKVWRQMSPMIFQAPQPLSILCRGLSDGAGSAWEVDLNFRQVSFWPVTGADTDLMRSLVRIDFATVVALLLSFLAVVLGYDGVCGERERGTLQVMMTNAVPRSTIILGKLMGGLLSLWAPLALSFTIALLILLSNPDVHFEAQDWLRLICFFVLSVLFLAQIFAFSLTVSVSTRDSATSLVICLFFWLIAGVGWANVLPSLSRYGVDEPPFQEFHDQNQVLWDKYNEVEQEWVEKHPPPADIYFEGSRGEVQRYQHATAYEWLARHNGYVLPKRLETEAERYKIWYANQMPLAEEGFLVDAWGLVSPMVNYQVLAYQLSRTTLSDQLFEGRAAHRYRATYYDWLQGRGTFSDRSWFTDDRVGQEPLIPDPESLSDAEKQADSEYMQGRRLWMAQQEEMRNANPASLDLTDMPKFAGTVKRSLGESFEQMVSGLIALLVTTALCAILLMWRFATYDPGR